MIDGSIQAANIVRERLDKIGPRLSHFYSQLSAHFDVPKIVKGECGADTFLKAARIVLQDMYGISLVRAGEMIKLEPFKFFEQKMDGHLAVRVM